MNEYKREYYQRNKERINQQQRAYYEAHKEEIRQRKKKYRLTHKENVKQSNKKYYETHKDKIKQKNKEYKLAHKEELKQYFKEYRDKHKEEHNESNRRYRATFEGYVYYKLHSWRNRGVKINSWQEYVDAYNRAGGKCEICGKPLKLTKFDDGDFEVARLDHDHETGMIRGILCDECNRMVANFNLNKKALDYIKNSELKNIIPIEDNKTPKEIRIEREKNWKHKGIKITWEEYVGLYNMADGKCEICGKPLKLTKADDGDGIEVANVDHDHISGRPRGIVCRRCNSLIKTMELNEKALKYLSGEKL